MDSIILRSFSLLVASYPNRATATDATFYEHDNFNGKSITKTITSSCQNFDGEWNDAITSVNTRGACIRVYEHQNCGGATTDIAAGTPSHNNLGDFGWNDMISSFRGCSGDDGGDDNGGWRTGALDAHNKYRARHGVPALTLTDEVNNSAQNCADYFASRKIFDHVCGQVFGHHYGENLAGGSGFNDAGDAAVQATDMWYSEEPKHAYNNNDFQYESGHFSQVVWKNTQRLGLGYSRNGDFKVVVGHYDPPGNYPGQFIDNVLRPKN